MEIEQAIGILQQRHFKIAATIGDTSRAMAMLERDYHKLLNNHPDHPGLLFGLGTIYSQSDRGGAGIAMLRRALDCGAGAPETWLNMGAAYKSDHKDASAAKCYQTVLEIIEKQERKNAKALRNGKKPPHDPEMLKAHRANALHGMASLYVNAGQPEKIIHWADKALVHDPQDRYALWNKGLGLLESGQFAEGFRLYDEAGFMATGTKPPERKIKTYNGLPKWDGTPGKTVICYGEQGIGDELMLSSMLPDLLRDCKVIIDCDPRLEKMFRRSFPQAEAVYPTSEWDAPFPWIKDHTPDAWFPMGSLGRYYRLDFASFPRVAYIKPDAEKVAKWGRILGVPRGLRVGISWAGGLKRTRFDQRTMPLIQWTDILKTPGVEFYSLQYHDIAADEAAEVGAKLGVPIHHYGDMIADYEETSGFLRHMDLVITVNTSLLHLAGSLGVPTWCLTPKMCAWRYGCSGENPWYGSVRTIRQEKAGDWRPVLDRVASDLRSMREVEKEAA